MPDTTPHEEDAEIMGISLPGLPKSIAKGVAWILVFCVFANWVGWLEAPGSALARQRSEVSKMADSIREQGKALDAVRSAVQLLEYRDTARKETLDKLDQRTAEMERLLYSLDRRSR